MRHAARGMLAMLLVACLCCLGCKAEGGTAPLVTASPRGTSTPLPSSTPAPLNQPVFIATERAQLHREGTAQSETMLTVARGVAGVRNAVAGSWSEVTMAGVSGFVLTEQLSETKVDSRMPKTLTTPKVKVYKSARRLELWDGQVLMGSYSVGLGFAPVGTKHKEGDGKTPEGSYYICLKNPNSSYYLSLGVSYPNKQDAQTGLDAGLIDRATYDRIVTAQNNKARPPWNTALGGEIMIHGMGGERDWTLGCIAVDNAVMDLLFSRCPLGMPLDILP